MNNKGMMQILDEIFLAVFEIKNPFSEEKLLEKFAFDLRLPQPVKDSLTGQITWTASVNPTQFITQKNMANYNQKYGWILPKKKIKSLDDIFTYWKLVNYTTTERVYDSKDIYESDTIYSCENIYRSLDCRTCKNSVFLDGCNNCEYLLASQRSATSSFSIRIDDSHSCSNSYNVICSSKISNSFFIQDCSNLHECMFCSHISNQRFHIANMPFEEDEYFTIKKSIIKWILN